MSLFTWFGIGLAAGAVSNHFKQKRISGENIARELILAASQNDARRFMTALANTGGNYQAIAAPNIWWIVGQTAASEVRAATDGMITKDQMPSFDLLERWTRDLS